MTIEKSNIYDEQTTKALQDVDEDYGPEVRRDCEKQIKSSSHGGFFDFAEFQGILSTVLDQHYARRREASLKLALTPCRSFPLPLEPELLER